MRRGGRGGWTAWQQQQQQEQQQEEEGQGAMAAGEGDCEGSRGRVAWWRRRSGGAVLCGAGSRVGCGWAVTWSTTSRHHVVTVVQVGKAHTHTHTPHTTGFGPVLYFRCLFSSLSFSSSSSLHTPHTRALRSFLSVSFPRLILSSLRCSSSPPPSRPVLYIPPLFFVSLSLSHFHFHTHTHTLSLSLSLSLSSLSSLLSPLSSLLFLACAVWETPAQRKSRTT